MYVYGYQLHMLMNYCFAPFSVNCFTHRETGNHSTFVYTPFPSEHSNSISDTYIYYYKIDCIKSRNFNNRSYYFYDNRIVDVQ